MSFISNAQHLEDVILWRTLRHVEASLYVDVGAWDPRQNSITLAFYKRGWRGINIEPDPKAFPKLEATRLRDINLQVALADKVGQQAFHSFEETGCSTLNRA